MNAVVYQPMTDLMSAIGWGAVFIAAGLAQVSAVMMNGSWRRSPHIRQIMLWFSIVSFAFLAIVFWGIPARGAAIQSSTQQALNAIMCLWCFLNITAKRASA